VRGPRHSEEQIIGILKQAEKGVAADLCRQHGISEQIMACLPVAPSNRSRCLHCRADPVGFYNPE